MKWHGVIVATLATQKVKATLIVLKFVVLKVAELLNMVWITVKKERPIKYIWTLSLVS